MARTIAIGDVHGCAAALEAVLAHIAPTPDDLLVMLGDYVDRGPDSRGVLEQLLDLRERCRLVLVRGNHEVMMLDALDDPALRDFWLINGGLQTLTSYGGRTEQVDAAHRALLSQCVPHFETERYLLVHANYMPHLPMSEQPDRVRLWQHLTTHTPGPHESGKTAIVGHTPQFDGDILDLGHVICLDTCCFGGGYLTAMELDSRQLWQADVHGRMRGA